jgi:large subunit ribosomal protein L28
VLNYTSYDLNLCGLGSIRGNDTAKKVFRKGGKRKLAGKCERCGKTPGYGHNVSHSNRKTNRMWMPNIQSKKVQLDGDDAPRKHNICTQCMRTLLKTGA